MTRQVSTLAAQAFVERRTRKISSNTYTNFGSEDLAQGLFLFGNRIAWYDRATDVPYVCFAGWATRTTLCRIKHVIQALGVQGVDFSIREQRRCGGTPFSLIHATVSGPKLYMNGVEHDPGENIALVGILGAIALKFERDSSSLLVGNNKGE